MNTFHITHRTSFEHDGGNHRHLLKLISTKLLNRKLYTLNTHESCIHNLLDMCCFSELELSKQAAILSSSALCQKAVHLTWTPAAPVISCTTDGDLTPITHSNPTA